MIPAILPVDLGPGSVKAANARELPVLVRYVG